MRSPAISWLLATALLGAACTGAAGTGAGSDEGAERDDVTVSISTTGAPDATASSPQSPATGPVSTDPPTTSTEPAPEPVVVPELQFVGSTLSGGQLNGSDYAGTDTVFWFWAPW